MLENLNDWRREEHLRGERCIKSIENENYRK